MESDLRFLYRCDSCGRFWAVGCGNPLWCDRCNSKERTHHTATVSPGTALVALLNADDAERARLLAGLKGEEGGGHAEG